MTAGTSTDGTSGLRLGRVLVVDDDAALRETLGQLLLDEGYFVDLAVDGATALERIHAARPDTILLDLLMPGMNGRQFLEALREEPAYAGVPVMIMTAVHGTRVELATLGASEIFEKPLDIDDLLNKVALAVYQSRESNRGLAQPIPIVAPPSALPSQEDPRVVILLEHDRSRLQQLEVKLTERSYTVVSMTRASVHFSRLVRALRPCAILLDWVNEGIDDIVCELDDTHVDMQLPILVFSRSGGTHTPGTLEQATDLDLLSFVESQRARWPSG